MAPADGNASRRRTGASGKFPHFWSEAGKTRDKIGVFAGVSGRTVEKIAKVVAAAEAEPEKFGKLQADMDRTGSVNGVYRRLRNMQQAEKIRAEPPPLPRGPFRVIVADVPWPYEVDAEDPSGRGVHPYSTMSLADICALPVRDLAADDAILWLWITNHHLLAGSHVPILKAWGFEAETILTWAKDRFGYGHWLRGQTEHCIMAVRGNPTTTLTNQSTWLDGADAGAFSKARGVLRDGRELCPAPAYLELFARRARPGWTAWGAEAPQDSEPETQIARTRHLMTVVVLSPARPGRYDVQLAKKSSCAAAVTPSTMRQERCSHVASSAQ